MVFVGVRDEDASHFVFVLNQISEVRDNNVDAQHLFVRERQTAIDDNDVIVLTDDRTVLTDFSDAPKGYNFNDTHSALHAYSATFSELICNTSSFKSRKKHER